MQIDVARAIEEVLDQRKAVNIQGLGSLILEDTPASVSGDSMQIYPPTTELRFYETKTKNGPLRKHLMYKYNLKKEDAQKVIKKFSQSTVNTLLNYKEVNIKGVTRIKKSGLGYEIKPKKSFINKYYGGLPVLDMPKSKKWGPSKKKAKKSKVLAPPPPITTPPSPTNPISSAASEEKKEATKESKKSDIKSSQLKSPSEFASSVISPKEIIQKKTINSIKPLPTPVTKPTPTTVSKPVITKTTTTDAATPKLTAKPTTPKEISTPTPKSTPVSKPATPVSKPIVKPIIKATPTPVTKPATKVVKKIVPTKTVVQTKKAIVPPPVVSSKPTTPTTIPTPPKKLSTEPLKAKHALKSGPPPVPPTKPKPSPPKVVDSSKKNKVLTLNEKLGIGTAGSSAAKATTAVKSGATDAGKAIKESFKIDTPITKANVIPPPVRRNEGIGCVGPLLALLAFLLMFYLLYLGYKKVTKKIQVLETAKTELVDEAQVDGSDGNETAGNSEFNPSSEEGEATNEITSGGLSTCVIITGVFSEYRNVNSMESILENRGYSVYTEEYGPYTRIGFEYDCSNSSETDLDDYLRNIRATIPTAHKAWYLEPDHYVEY